MIDATRHATINRLDAVTIFDTITLKSKLINAQMLSIAKTRIAKSLLALDHTGTSALGTIIAPRNYCSHQGWKLCRR
jgi:hypothetical protein